MSELPQPVKHVLDESVDEEAVYRIWRNVGRARAAAWRERERTRRTRRGLTMGAVGIAAAAAAVLVVWQTTGSTAGPLRTAGGVLPSVMQTPAGATAPEVTRFDDESRIVVTPGSRLVAEHNTAERFETRLARGRVEVEVEPGGPRRWRVDAGLASVEVLGTRFVVDRAPTRVRVEVLRGRVAVEDHVDERRRELTAGESIVVERGARSKQTRPDSPERAPPETEDTGAEPLEPPGPLAEEQDDAVGHGQPRPRWRDLAHRGRYDDAYDVLGREGLERESRRASPEQLLELADVARLSGHPEQAVAPLERMLREHPDDGRAGLAAFTLGVVHMDQRAAPAAAAEAFERSLELEVPAPLRGDALARLAEARGRAGDTEGARKAATRYLERYPDGERGPDVERWLSGDE